MYELNEQCADDANTKFLIYINKIYYINGFAKEGVIHAQRQLHGTVMHAGCEAEKTDKWYLN